MVDEQRLICATRPRHPPVAILCSTDRTTFVSVKTLLRNSGLTDVAWNEFVQLVDNVPIPIFPSQRIFSGKNRQPRTSPPPPRLAPYCGSQTSTVCTHNVEIRRARTLRSAVNPDKQCTSHSLAWLRNKIARCRKPLPNLRPRPRAGYTASHRGTPSLLQSAACLATSPLCSRGCPLLSLRLPFIPFLTLFI